MPTPLPSPTGPVLPRGELLLQYLDHFREAVALAVRELDEQQARTSLLPSGWSPLELEHDGRWHVAEDATVGDVVRALERQGDRTRQVVRAHELSDVGAPGERWDGADPATLERVLLHLLQEHARHAGHLEIVRELLNGSVSDD